METFLQSTHNIMRWAVVLTGLWSLITAIRGFSGQRAFTTGDKRAALFFMTACDIQLLLGLSLYITKGYHRNFSGGNMGAVMKDGVARFWTIEHTIGMIIALILVHAGYAGTKGTRPPIAKFRRLFWCTITALVLIAMMAPWPFRAPGIARPWWPSM